MIAADGMWVLIVLQLLMLLTLVLLLVIGPIIMLVGKVRKNQKQFRLGLKLFGIPIVIISAVSLYFLSLRTFAVEPTKADLVGNYILANPNTLNGGKGSLRLHENGQFTKSFNFRNVNCEKGKYNIYDDEIWFSCDGHASTATIEKGLFGFKLKFITGNNSNSDENLIFKKVH